METGSPVMYHGTGEHQFPQGERGKEMRFAEQLSPQEKEVFRQCNKESFIYRCFPLSVTGMAATYYAVKKGYLAPNPRYGAAVKMTGAAILGWVVGKISYASVCQEKFLKLENSRVADSIRRKKGIYKSEEFQSEFSESKSSEEMALRDDSFGYQSDTYHSSAGSLNLDVDKNIQYSGFDDRERPSTDNEIMEVPEKSEPVKHFTTYEDLRKRNREDYERLQRPYGSRFEQTPTPGMQGPWSNVDSTPRSYSDSTPRGYSNPSQGETRNNQDTWDNSRFS